MKKYPTRILIVDDEDCIRQSLKMLLESNGYQVETVNEGKNALAKIQTSYFNLLIVDIKMPGMSGLEFMHKIRQIFPGNASTTTSQIIDPKVAAGQVLLDFKDPKEKPYLPTVRPLRVGDTTKPFKDIIIITGYANLERAIECLRMGAFDFVQKPFEAEVILNSVKRCLEIQQLRKELLTKEKLASMTELAGAAAHELSQPLTVASLQIQLVMELIKKFKENPTQVISLQAIEDFEKRIDTAFKSLEDVALIIERIRKVAHYVTKEYIPGLKIVDFEAEENL